MISIKEDEILISNVELVGFIELYKSSVDILILLLRLSYLVGRWLKEDDGWC